MKTTKLECQIEFDRRYADASYYVVNAGEVAFDVVVVSRTCAPQPVLKKWLHRVRRLYIDKKHRKIVVGINAGSRNESGGIPGVGKNWYYDILQICVGEHCLLIAIEPCTAAHPSVKDFLKRLFRDDSFVFVGFRINDFSDEYKDTDFKVLLDIPNPVDLKELAAREPRFVGLNFEKWGFEKLVKLVLDVEYERPTRIPIYAADHTCEYSDELVLWSSVDVFLIAKMGMVLLSV